jgi:hypothetical protein
MDAYSKMLSHGWRLLARGFEGDWEVYFLHRIDTFSIDTIGRLGS